MNENWLQIIFLRVFLLYSFSGEITWTYTGEFKFICRAKSQSVPASEKKTIWIMYVRYIVAYNLETIQSVIDQEQNPKIN